MLDKYGYIETIITDLRGTTDINFQMKVGEVLKVYCKSKKLTYEMPNSSGGDDKNDGWIVELKRFYQIFSPQQLRDSLRKDIQKKFTEDLEKLLELLYVTGKWNGEIKDFIFIVNTIDRNLPHDSERYFESERLRFEGKYNISFNAEVVNVDYIRDLLEELNIDELSGLSARLKVKPIIDYNAMNSKLFYESILKENFKNNFKYDKFLEDYRATSVNNISQINYFGLSLSPEIIKSRKLLEDIYVIPDFKFVNKEDEIESTDENSQDRVNINLSNLLDKIHGENKHLVILGKPGAGKSILIQYLMYIILNKKIEHPIKEYIPIRVELRKYLQFKNKESLNLSQYIHQVLIEEYGITNLLESNVNNILNNKKTLMLFDGLDEIFHVNDKIKIKHDIENFLLIHKNSKGIVTSRNIGYEDTKMNKSKFTETEIMDFDNSKIKEYVRKWYNENEKDKGVLKKEVESFLELKKELDEELVTNPLFLSLIVILYRNNGKLPNSKLEIYRGCTNTLVEEWDENKELKLELQVKNKKVRIFTNLSFWQYTKLSKKQESSTVPITYRNVLKQVQSIILSFGDVTEDSYEAEKIAKEFLEYAKKRSVYFDNSFTHKTFHEYYTALWIYQNYDAKGRFEKRNEIITTYINNPYWYVVLELLISMIDEQQGDDDVINELINEQIQSVNNIYAHYFFLRIINQITNVGDNVMKKLIKQSIKLSLNGLNLKEETKFKRTEVISREVFDELYKIKSNDRFSFVKPLLAEKKRVILQPIGAKNARKHYIETLVRPVDLLRIEPFISRNEYNCLKELYPNGLVPIFGIPPSVINVKRWEKILAGDVAFFSANHMLCSSGIVTYKLRNAALAENLWGTDQGGQTREYIYFLCEIKDHNIEIEQFNEIIGYSSHFRVMGLTVLDEYRSNAILNYVELQSGTHK